MKENVLLEKSYQFALRIVKLCQYLRDEAKEFVLSPNILRDGANIGAFVEEAYQAESTADFVHLISIANKNAFRTDFWLRLLRDGNHITEKQAASMLDDCVELKKMLISTIKTSKKKLDDVTTDN
jgi:four helix bundle protein